VDRRRERSAERCFKTHEDLQRTMTRFAPVAVVELTRGNAPEATLLIALLKLLKDIAREDHLFTINRRSYRFESLEILACGEYHLLIPLFG
jgi:hypothetical protein